MALKNYKDCLMHAFKIALAFRGHFTNQRNIKYFLMLCLFTGSLLIISHNLAVINTWSS